MVQKRAYTAQSKSEGILTQLLGRLLLELSVELGGKTHFPRFSIVFGAFTVNIYYLFLKLVCVKELQCGGQDSVLKHPHQHKVDDGR